MIVTVQPGLTDKAMVEAIQIATEGRVRALYEAGIRSSVSGLNATGTGTDCMAIVSLDRKRALLRQAHSARRAHRARDLRGCRKKYSFINLPVKVLL
jgi:hypothetical protein